jgi:hypothetical protein
MIMRRFSIIVPLLMLVLVAGCGKETKEKKTGKEAFRVPDSLLSSVEGYRLTVDEYDVIKGGVMANAQIEVRYPASDIARYVSVRTFGIAKTAYDKVSKEIGPPAAKKLVLIGASDLDEYRFLTRKEWWYYGYVHGDTIYFEPFDILMRRNIAEVSITQRIAQAALNRRSGGNTPLWLREALASRIAGEGDILKIQMPEFEKEGRNMSPSPEEIENAIAAGADRGDSRIAYFSSYGMLEKLLAMHSMDHVLSFLDKLKEGKTLDESSEEAFGMGYGALMDKLRIDR